MKKNMIIDIFSKILLAMQNITMEIDAILLLILNGHPYEFTL